MRQRGTGMSNDDWPGPGKCASIMLFTNTLRAISAAAREVRAIEGR